MGSSLSCTVRSDRVETDGGQGGTPLEKSRLRRLLNAQQTNTQNSTSREASPVSGTSEKKNDQSRSPKGLDFHVLVHCIYKECRKGSELTLKEKMEVLRLSVEEGKADTASAVFLALVKIHGALRAEPKKEKDPLPALPSPPPVSSSLDPPTDPPDHKQEGRKEKSADAEKSTKKEKHVDETEACAAAVAQLAPSALRVALQGNAQSVPPSRRLRLIREAERIAGELPEGAAAELDSALKTILPQSWQASFDGQTCRVWNYWKLGGGERSVHFVQSRLDRGLKVGGKCRVSVRFLGGLDWDRDEDPLPPRAFSKTQGNLTTFICYRTTRMARLQRELTKARAGKRKTSSAAQVSSEKETDKKQTEAPASSSEEKGKIGIDEVENGGGGVGEVSFRIFVEYRALQSVLFPSQPSESSALPPLTADEFRQIFPTPSSRSEASGAASEDEQEGKNERGEKETEQSDKRAEGKKKESKKEECPPWAPISVVELSGETRWCSLGLEGESGAPLFPLLAHEEHLPLPSGYCMRPFPSRSLVDEVDEAEAGRKEVQSARAGSGRGAGGGEQGSGGGAGRSDHPAVGAASSRRQQHVGGNGWGCSSPQSREEKEWEKQQLDKMYSASKTKEKTKKNEGGASSSSAYPPGGPVSPSLVSPQGTPLVWYPGLLGLSPSETIRILKAERDKEREKEKKAKTPNVSADVKHKADKDKGKALATGGGGKTAGSSVPKTKSSSPPLPTSSKTKRGPGQDEARDPKQEERKDKKEVGKKANGEEEKAKEKVEKKERKERERTEKEKEISCLSEEEKKEQEGKKKEEEKSMSNAPKIPPHFKSTDETDEKEGEKRKQDPPDPSQPPSAEKKKTEEQKTAEPGKGKACQTEPLSPRAQLKEGQEAACEKRKSEKALEQRETEPKGQDRKDIEKTTTVDKSTPADIDSFEEEEEEKKKKEKKQQKGSEDREGGANEEAKKEKEKETEAGQKREAEEVEQKNREEKETPEAISAPEKDTKRENNIEKEKKEKDDAIPPPSSAPADEEKRDLREKQTSNRPSSKERKEPEKETAKPPTAPTVTFPVEGHEKEKKEKGKEKSRTKDKHKEKEKERKPETDKENRLFPSTYKSTRCICDGCGKSIDYEKEGAWHAATDQYDLCALCGDVWPYPPAREVHLADEKNALWVLPHIANWVSVCGKGQGIASNPFNLSGVEGLTLSFYPNGNKADCLSGHCSLFLNAPAGTFWEFRMQVGDSAAADSSHEFKESDKGWGFKNFCALDAFVDKASDSVRLKLEVLEDVSRRLHRSFTKEEDSFVRDLAPEARERLLQGIVDLESYRSNKGRKEGEPADLSSPGAPLRLRLLALEIPLACKALVMQKFDSYSESFLSERSKLKDWLEGLLRIPFGKYMPPPVVLSDGARKVQLHMRTVKKNLDEAIFGHDHAKQRVLQLACQWVTNPKSQTQVVGVVGPPGNGKTTLVREGIARALGRPLVQISLGGAKDSSILEGHSFTYVGAQCGRIASALQEARVMNPLLYLDELDKVSETHHGAEIIGVLTHLTDPAQNAVFADNYFAGIPLDLSRSLLVFSFNDEAKINPVLRDRLTVIRVKGFNVEEKIRIAQDYLLPRLLEKVGLTKGDVMVEADAVSWIVHQLPDQEGVRGLLHALESAIIQMNFVRLMQEAREEEENAAASAEKTEGTPEREGVADAEETDENANKSGVSPSEGETGRSGEKEGNGELGDDVREGKSPAAPPPSLPVSSNKEEDEGKEGKAPGWEGGGFSPFPAPAAAAKETEAAETPPADLSLRGAPAARDSVEFFPDGEGGVLKEMKEKESVEKVEREKSGIIDAGENGKDEVAAVSAGGTETGRSPARDSDSGRMRENEQIESPKLTKGTQEGSSVSPAEDPNDTTEKEKAKNEEESPSPQDKKDQPEGSPPPLSLEPRDALDVSCEKRGDEREQQNTEEQNRQNPLRLPLERRPLAKLNAADDEDTGGQASETPREVSPLSPFPSAPQERGIALEGLSVGVAGEEAQEGEESPVIVVLDPEDDLVDVEGGGENTDGDEKERESERKSSSDPHSAASPQTQRPAGSPSTFVSVSRADEEDPDALAAGGAADASPSPSDSPSASADSPVGGDLCQPVPPTSFVVSGDPFLADCSSEKEKEKEQEKERSAVQGDGGGDVKPDPSVRSPPVHPSQGVDCLPSGVGGDLPPSPSSSAVAMGPPLLSLSASTLDKSGDSMGVVEGGGGGAEGKAASTEGQPPEKGETVMEGGGKETEKGRSVQISLNHHGSGCGDGEAEAEGGVGDKGKGEGQEGAKGGEKPEEGTGEGPATAAAECAAEKGGEAEDSADNSKKEAEGGDGGDDGGANSAGGKGGKRRRRGVAMIDRKDEFGISLSWPRIVLPFVITREWMERLATIEEVAGGPPPGMYL